MDFLVLNQTDTLTILQNKKCPQPALALVLLAPANNSYQSSAAAVSGVRPWMRDGDSLHFRVELDTQSAGLRLCMIHWTNPELFSHRGRLQLSADSVALTLNLTAEGLYRWNVQARDHADGGQVSETRTLIIDRTALVLESHRPPGCRRQNWINLEIGVETSVQLNYTELYPDSAMLELIGIGQLQIKTFTGRQPAKFDFQAANRFFRRRSTGSPFDR